MSKMSKPIHCIVLTNEVLSCDSIMGSVGHETCGAISLFVGTTRNNNHGKQVIKLEYECYEKMAEKEMKKICDDIQKKWPSIYGIAIHHRLGHVPVKDASIIIAISAPHRKDAMDASQYCINTLKANVPIWKKEIYKDGSGEWQENQECSWKNP